MAETILVLRFVLCVQGIAAGEGKKRDPLSPSTNCAYLAVLSAGNPVMMALTSSFFTGEP